MLTPSKVVRLSRRGWHHFLPGDAVFTICTYPAYPPLVARVVEDRGGGWYLIEIQDDPIWGTVNSIQHSSGLLQA